METIKKYKKIVIAIIFIIAILIGTKVEAEEVNKKIEANTNKELLKESGAPESFIPFYDNVKDHHFHPYNATKSESEQNTKPYWTFYCVQRGYAYGVRNVDGLDINKVYYECTTQGCNCQECPKRPEGTKKEMSYQWTGRVNEKKYQDAAYVMARARFEGTVRDFKTQLDIWKSSLDHGINEIDNGSGLYTAESQTFKNWYDKIHHNGIDVYSSTVKDKTVTDENKENSVKVVVDENKYIVGPFKVEYAYEQFKEENKINNIWSYIDKITVLGEDNKQVYEYTPNIKVWNNNKFENIQEMDIPTLKTKHGIEAQDGTKKSEVPHSDQLFYVEFTPNKAIHNMKLKITFKYLESCNARLEKYTGTMTQWLWDDLQDTKKCTKCGHTLKAYTLHTQTVQSQELIAFKYDENEQSGSGDASMNYKTYDFIVAPGGIDLTMKIEGDVFLDKDDGKDNEGSNVNDKGEALPGVEVVLYYADGDEKDTVVPSTKRVVNTYTDETTKVKHNHDGNEKDGGACYEQKHVHIVPYYAEKEDSSLEIITPPNMCDGHWEGHEHTDKCYTTGSGVCTKYMKQSSYSVNNIGWKYWEHSENCNYRPIITDGNGNQHAEDVINVIGLVSQGFFSYDDLRKGSFNGSTYKIYKGKNESDVIETKPCNNGCTMTKTIIQENGKDKYTVWVHSSACMKINDCIESNITVNKDGYIKEDNTITQKKEEAKQESCTYSTKGDKILTCGKSATKKWIIDCTKNEGYKLTCTKEYDEIRTIKEGEPEITHTLTNPVLTDENGHYIFEGLDSQRKYYVKFVYNGMMYTNVLPFYSDQKALNGNADENNTKKVSKATEDKAGSRGAFNDQFAEIGSYPENYEIKNKVFEDIGNYNKVYMQTDENIVKIFKKISEKMVNSSTTMISENNQGVTTANNNGGVLTPENNVEVKSSENEMQALRVKEACKKVYDELEKDYRDETAKTELKRMIQFARDCRIESQTVKNYPLSDKFTIDKEGSNGYPAIYSENYNRDDNGKMTGEGKYNQVHVNLGIKARATFDIALYKDVLNAKVSINGKEEIYTYDSRRQSSGFKFGVNEDDYLKAVRESYKAIKEEDIKKSLENIKNTSDIETDKYDLYVRPEDISNNNENITEKAGGYNLQDKDKLQILVAYKIAIKNQSSTIGAITEIVDYYDKNYEFVEAYVGDKDGNRIENGNVTKYDNSKYQRETEYKSSKNAYKTMYLRPDNETRLGNGEEQYIYVVLKLIGDKQNAGEFLANELKDKDTLNTLNLAEINGYKTYNSKEDETTPGLIDRDSNPGNLNISDIEALTQENIVNYKNIKEMYEDDTNRAPALIFKKANASRTLSGNVFEDTTATELKTGQKREGNGLFENDDKNIQGVQVELYEMKNNDEQLRATTTTDGNGKYTFTGFIPGDYKVKFTYGKTAETAMEKDVEVEGVKGLNDKSYNGQDYQSTQKSIHNGDWWYTETERRSDAKDTEDSVKKVIDYSNETDGVYIRNHKAKVFNSYKKDLPSDIKETERATLAQELMNNTYREAYTDQMSIEVEYATKTIEGNKSHAYEIQNVDFGIVERPRSELVIDQDVAHIKVTLSDGRVLFDAQDTTDNLQWIKGNNGNNVLTGFKTWVTTMLQGSKFDGYDKEETINVIMDDEIMNGAQIEITYDITVTNNGEQGIGKTQATNIINYVSNNLIFDGEDTVKINDKEYKNSDLWEVVSKEKINTENNTTYIGNNVNLDSQSVILKATDKNPLAKTKLNPRDSVTAQLKLKKVLSRESSSDDLTYTNMTEIVEIKNDFGRYDHGAIPGNQKLEEQPKEHDTSGASKYVTYDESGNIDSTYPQDGTVIVTPPTGSTYIYYVISIAGALILAVGIFLIKKFVIDTRK